MILKALPQQGRSVFLCFLLLTFFPVLLPAQEQGAAPALAAATVGIAMGEAGTDVALETADIALMADDLSHLPLAIRFLRKTSAIIKQNIAFSIAIKAVFIVLALVGWATLWMAVAADMGASLAVIANGLRTLRTNNVDRRANHPRSPRNGRVIRRGYPGGGWWSLFRALTMATTMTVTTEVPPISIRDTAKKPPPLPSEWRKRANPRISKPAPIAAMSFKGTFLASIQSGFLRGYRGGQCNAGRLQPEVRSRTEFRRSM
jgi:hypothetical protein